MEPEDLGGLDLDQLSQVRIVSATLAPTETRLIPATTTTLDVYSIQLSGARTLNELLELSTPNTQLILHNGHLDHFGIRGTISDRDDKYLLRVNGKVMNNRFLVGAESERDLPLLGDFAEASLVYGPASATYGAGALTGVLNLETFNGLTFQGCDLHLRQTFGDAFSAGEWRFGKKLGRESGFFVYAGLATQQGATQSDSPYVFGKSFVTPGPGPDAISGQAVSFAVPNLHDGAGLTKAKFHLDYIDGPFELWARYTQSAGVVRAMRSTLESVDISKASLGRGDEDRQFCTVASLKPKSLGEFSLESTAGYSFYQHDYALYDLEPDPLHRREHEIFARVLGTWIPSETHSVSLGTEYAHDWFSGPRLSIPAIYDSWTTNTFSTLAEHQWRIGRKWTLFTSGRTDSHSYTGLLFSPRMALVFVPTDRDTLKLIVARAARRSGDGELRQEHVQIGTKGESETLKSMEFSYEARLTQAWNFDCSVFLQENDAIGYSSAIDRSVRLGNFRTWGVEPQFVHRWKKNRLSVSHGYTKLLEAGLESPGTIQGISAAPYGFGRDLANWSNHITKASFIHELNTQWFLSASLRYYWGYPGARQLANWNATNAVPLNYALSEPGYEKAYGPSGFLNLGVAYRPGKSLTMRLDAYNVLGWADSRLNKRPYITRGSDYSVEAPSVAFSIAYSFGEP